MNDVRNEPAGNSHRGLLLVGHGTRNRQGQREFLQTAEMLADRLAGVIVQPCFLEFAEPDISMGISQLAQSGVQTVVVAPLLLFAAGHARQDIPEAVAAAAATYSNLHVRQCEVLGCHEALLKLSAIRFNEALADRPRLPPSETALLLVGRGSRDAAATAEMHRFARLRAKQVAADHVDVGFMAMAPPRIDEALSAIASVGVRRIVVQPHLLFQGDLLDRLDREVATARSQFPNQEFLVTAHLGPAPLLVDALVARFNDALYGS